MTDVSSGPDSFGLPLPTLPNAPLASPELASTILDSVADAVVVYDAAGRVVRSNPAAATLLGLVQPGRGAALDVPIAEPARVVELRTLEGQLLPYEKRPVVRVLRGETLSGTETVDIVAYTVDRQERILNVSGAPLLDAQQQVVGAVCVFRDSTERKHLERELAARAAEMETVFATQVEAVVFIDSTGRIIRMNQAQRRLLTLAGVNPSSEYIQTWAQKTAPHDALGHLIPRERLPFYRALRGEIVDGEQAVEFNQHTRRGREMVLRISGAPVRNAEGQILGAVLTSVDVTQQRRMERELAEHAAQIEGIFEAMVDGIILVDANGRIVRMNEAQRQVVGDDTTRDGASSLYVDYAERRLPRDLENRPFPKDQLPALRILRGEVLTGKNAVEIRIRALNGRELILQISGAPMRDAAGAVVGAVVAVRDVTERHQLEEQRRDILRVVAHDLLTPITGVRLYLQTQERRLRKGQPPFMPGEGHFDTLNTNLLKMERLVNDLRDLASIESGALTLERHPCDLSALCQQEVEVQQMLMPGRTIELVVPPEPILTDVDEQRVGQVIANFLSNALKYSPIDRPVTLTLRAGGMAVHLAVQDQGPGIPAGELDHIWEKFHRVEGIKAHGGTQSLGLGLYICRAIVEQHGGHIGVESTVGVGSTFWFTLPVAPTSASGEHAG